MTVNKQKTKWYGWGWSHQRYDMKGHDREVFGYLGEALGRDVSRPNNLPVNIQSISIPKSKLSKNALEALGRIVGPSNVIVERHERIIHASGKSLHDLLRIRKGKVEAVPDVVCYPETIEEIVALLGHAEEEGYAIVPFGGGSSVVGGVEARDPHGRSVITLDMARLERVLQVDGTSGLATVEAGVYGPILEEALGKKGYSLGHFPQSFEFSTLGGWIAARSAGQQSNQYGKIEDMLVSCRVVTPAGELKTLTVPASAGGPDLNHLICGSEGTLGVIADATVKIHPVPEHCDIRTVIFRNFYEGIDAVREITQSGLEMSYLRLSDCVETDTFLRLSGKNMLFDLGQRAISPFGYGDERSVMIVGAEGGRDQVRRDVGEALRICRKHRGLHIGHKGASSWKQDRFHHPYLRDSFLDHGVGTDTLETATTWSKVGELYRSVSAAIERAIAEQGDRSIVMAHLSHSYDAGTSIYFIFIYPLAIGREVEQWWPIKKAASDALARAGATISHHHGVGIDHKDWMEAEKGRVGLEVLRGVKERLDPRNIMNPGKLVP